MKKLFIAFFASIILVFSASADHQSVMWSPQGLPVDEFRGPWFATIDTEATDWAWKRQSELTRKGDTALRLEVRDGDCFTAEPHNPESGWDDCTRDRERSELRERWNPELDEYVWYTWSMFIPEDYEPMYPKQIFFQWHAGHQPVIYFHLNENKFHIDILTEEGRTTTQYTYGRNILTLGSWHDVVVRIKWSDKNEDGQMTLWVDNQLILDHVGATMDPKAYQKGKGPYAKFGIYRSHLFRWEEDRPHPTHIIYFDEYRRGYKYIDVKIANHAGD